MSYQIRFAQTNDLSAIVAIYNSTIASRQVTADLQPVTEQARQAWFNSHLQDAERPLYVVEHNQQIVAWGSFSDYYPRAAYRISAEISIYIAEQYRQKGLGQILLDYMHAQAAALNIHNIIAVIFAHNTPSMKLFERNGYQQWGYLPAVCQLDKQLADVVILGKKAA